VRAAEGRRASLLYRPAGSPVGHGEQREPRPIRGEPRWTDRHAHTRTHTRTHTHTQTHVHTHAHSVTHMSYVIPSALSPSCLEPQGLVGGKHTYTHTHTHTHTVKQSRTKVTQMCYCECTFIHTAEVFPVCNWR